MRMHLFELSKKFICQSEKVGVSLDALGRSDLTYDAVLQSKFLIIRLLDQWGRFSRDLILYSAKGGCVRSGGESIPKKFSSLSEAADAARLGRNGVRGREPRWHDAQEAVRVAGKLDIANRMEVVSTLGASNSPANSLRLLRNHFAHESSDDCMSKLKLDMISMPTPSPVSYIFEPTSAGEARHISWIRTLQSISIAATY